MKRAIRASLECRGIAVHDVGLVYLVHGVSTRRREDGQVGRRALLDAGEGHGDWDGGSAVVNSPLKDM